jgi:hypothetical protein
MKILQPSLKYNKITGYFLIELISSMILFSMIISITLMQYQQVHQLYLKLINNASSSNSLQKILLMICQDIKNAGMFGIYNLHYQDATNPQVDYALCNLKKFIAGNGIYSENNLISLAYGENIGTYYNIVTLKTEIEKLYFFYNHQDIKSAILLISDYTNLYYCRNIDLQTQVIDGKYLLLQPSNNCKIDIKNAIATLSTMNLAIKTYFIKNKNLYYQTVSNDCQHSSSAVVLANNIKTISLLYYLIDDNNHIIITNNILDNTTKVLAVHIKIADYDNNALESFMAF